MDGLLRSLEGFTETDTNKLQSLAIAADRILREEIHNSGLKSSLAEVRVYNIKTVGVQGDQGTYGHPAEITLKGARHLDENPLSEEEFYYFLGNLSTRITNEVRDINRVLYVTETRDDRPELLI